MRDTNLSDYDFSVFYLSKSGYGSLAEIEALDTHQFLNLIEYESILNAIEHYETKKATERH